MRSPGFHRTAAKAEARQVTLVQWFRKLCGLSKLPANASYVTLCWTNDNRSVPEIDQLVEASLVDETQVVGINRNSEIVRMCSRARPRAKFLCGDWSKCFHGAVEDGLRPVLVFLDTTSCADGQVRQIASTLNLLAERMHYRRLSKRPVLVVANVILKRDNWRKRLPATVFPRRIWPLLSPDNVPFIFWPAWVYTYSQSEQGATMGSYAFVVAPPEKHADLARRAEEIIASSMKRKRRTENGA